MKLKKLKISLAVVLLCTATTFANVQINETNFPDANFRSWLLEQDFGSKGYITDAEIENITEINIWNRNISDLTGINFFANLKYLDCNRNQLTSLDVSGLTNLEWLECMHNQLTSFNTLGLTNLHTLTLHGNQFTHFDVSKLTSLFSLTVSDNQLTALDVSALTNLVILGVNENQLTSLNISGLINLRELWLGNNQLTSLDVSGLTNLRMLSFPHNQLTSLDLTGIDHLDATWFNASNQIPAPLTLTGANNNYTLEIDLNNPINLVHGLSYFGGILTSTSNTITTSPFAVETGNPNFTLSGTLTLNYETETSVREINANRQAIGFYTITGIKLQTEPQSGMFIILYNDGTSEKVMR